MMNGTLPWSRLIMRPPSDATAAENVSCETTFEFFYGMFPLIDDSFHIEEPPVILPDKATQSNNLSWWRRSKPVG